MNRGDFIQYRSRDQEGDCDGTRVTGGGSGEHIKGEEGRVLVLLT